MSSIQVESLTFDLAPGADCFQYEHHGKVIDTWPSGAKVVDFIVIFHESVLLVEVKDLRVITCPPRPSNLLGLAETVAQKVGDTLLLGLPAVARSSTDAEAHRHATASLLAPKRRVVLHLEPHPPGGPRSALFPHGFQALVLQKLRQLLSRLAPDPILVDCHRTPDAGLPWSVRP